MNNINKDITNAYQALFENEGPYFTNDITPEIAKQAKALDKESKLGVGDSKKVSIAFMIQDEVIGIIWSAWDSTSGVEGEPEYSKGFDVFSSDIAVFEKFQGQGIGTHLVSKSHELYENEKGSYGNPKAIIEIKSQTMLKARLALGYEIVDRGYKEVKVAKV
jgi:GNAT superfamily N-acetyltransferase